MGGGKLKLKKIYVKHVVVGLFILILVPPYLDLFSTYLHEKSHEKYFNEYGICGEIEKPTITNAVPKFYGEFLYEMKYDGRITFCDEKAKEEYLNLTNQQREKLTMAGIRSDLLFIWNVSLVLIITFVIMLSLILLTKNTDMKAIFLLYFVIFALVMIIFLLGLSEGTLRNLTQHAGDLPLLLRSWKCG